MDAWIGPRLRVIRTQSATATGGQAFTLQDVALGMHTFGHTTWRPGTVSNVEHGKRNLTVTELADLCAVLHTTVEGLFATVIDADGKPVDPIDRDAEGFRRASALLEVAGQVRIDVTPGKRRATAERVTKRVYRAVFGHVPTAEQLQSFQRYTTDLYGHDLLAERDRLVAAGVASQWATRQITEQLRAERIRIGGPQNRSK